MPIIPCGIQVTTQHLGEMGQDLPLLVEVVKVRSYTKEKDSVHSLLPQFVLSSSE